MLKSEQNNEIPWKNSAYTKSIKQWKRFMYHDFNDTSRKIAYTTINNIVSNLDCPKFCEVGFGQLYDFEQCFKELHDNNLIDYCGIDITSQFVEFAKEIYPEYNFKVAGFSDLEENKYSIIFTRHVFEHLSKGVFRTCFRRMLYASNQYAIISWAQRPIMDGNYRFIEDKSVHFNAHDRITALEIIGLENYYLKEVIEVPHPDKARCIWVLEKTK